MSDKQSKLKSGLWLSTLISVIGLLLIVFIAAIVEKTLDPNFNKNLLTILSVIIACIPPVLWMTFFYNQDRLNPEPKSCVFKTMILGALVQKAIYSPITELIFPGKMSSALAQNYIMTIILLAVIQESVKLLSLRYSIYSSREFDEKVDGIIYGSALGLGFAAMTSIDFILASGGAMLTNVTSKVVIETFLQASITGLSGYILGVSKQKKFNILRLPAAVIIASALNAITQFLMNIFVRKGFKVNYIVGLVPTALVAVSLYIVLVIISSRNEKEGSVTTDSIISKEAFLGIIPVWIILAIAITGGFFSIRYTQKTKTYTVESVIELKIPSNWIQQEDENSIFKAGNMISGGNEFVSVKKFPLSNMMCVESNSHEELLQNAAAAWSIKSGMNYKFYQTGKSYFLHTKGEENYVIDYIYIEKGIIASNNVLQPQIGYARDIISIFDDNLYVTTISSRYRDYILDENILNDINYVFLGN